MMPRHRHRHSICDKKECPICNTANGPILCDEIILENKTKLITTQREKDIAKIITFFYNKCRDDILDKERLFTLPDKSFPWFLADVVYQYYTVNSRGWSYQIHNLSQTFEKDYILVKLYQSALYYDVDHSYRDFLHTNNLTHFLPANLEEVD